MSTSRRLCSRAPRTEIRSGSPAGTLGAGRAFEAADTALATGAVVAFFPLAAGCARLVADFAGALVGALAGALAGGVVGVPAGAFALLVAADLVDRFAAGRAAAAFA